MIDTHCHLNDSTRVSDPAREIAEALAAGVEQIVVVGINREWSARAVGLAEEVREVFAVVGHHPTSTETLTDADLAQYEEWFEHPKVVGLGEMGLDYYWNTTSPAHQDRVLRAQWELAVSLQAPVVLHCRDAYRALLDLLDSIPFTPHVLHCFGGTPEDASRAAERGSYFGVDGPITYKNAHELRSTVARLPRDRVVLETDAPWLAPYPHRGKPNRLAYLPLIADGLAATWGVSTQETIIQTSANARRLFPKLAG